MTSTTPEYLTIAEAAGLPRVSDSTIRRWIRDGGLPAHRVGKRRLVVKRDDVARTMSAFAMEVANSASQTNRVSTERWTTDASTTGPRQMDRKSGSITINGGRQRDSERTTDQTIEFWNERGQVPTRGTGAEHPTDPDDFDLGPIASLIEQSPDRPIARRLTDEEVAQDLAALKRAAASAERLRARNGGRLIPCSVPIVHEMREERTRQLMGDEIAENGPDSHGSQVH